ncbi:ArsR/SmtB family transcription factor [Geodermatophilus sp. SYSU D00815]
MTDELLRALGDPTRRRVVELLAGEQLCVCHLVESTGATQTNLSNHLRVLRELGIVEPEPAGRFTYYRLRPEVLEAVSAHYAQLAARARRATGVKRPCGWTCSPARRWPSSSAPPGW